VPQGEDHGALEECGGEWDDAGMSSSVSRVWFLWRVIGGGCVGPSSENTHRARLGDGETVGDFGGGRVLWLKG